MFGNVFEFMRQDVHHYMELLALKGELFEGPIANDNAVNDNLLRGQISGDSEAVA